MPVNDDLIDVKNSFVSPALTVDEMKELRVAISTILPGVKSGRSIIPFGMPHSSAAKFFDEILGHLDEGIAKKSEKITINLVHTELIAMFSEFVLRLAKKMGVEPPDPFLTGVEKILSSVISSLETNEGITVVGHVVPNFDKGMKN